MGLDLFVCSDKKQTKHNMLEVELKKLSLFSILVILAMLLAACGGAGDNGQLTPGPEEGIATDSGLGLPTEDLSGGVGGDLATEPVATEDLSGGANLATEAAPTAASTEVGGLQGTSVPNTGAGFGEFARMSQFVGDLGFFGADGGDLGQVEDFVINIPGQRVDYVVVSMNGQSVLVPFSSLAFDRENGGYTFNGNLDNLNNAPAFSAGDFDFTDENWDQDVIDFWRGSNNSASGTPVAASTSDMSSASPTMDAGSAGSATQSATQEVTDPGLNNGPAFQNEQFAVLYSELISMDVVSGNGANNNNNAGSDLSGTQAAPSAQSTGSAMATPEATMQSGSGSGSGDSLGSSSAQDGENIGQVVDGIINLTSGDVPYLMLSVSGAGMSNNSSSGSDAGAGSSMGSSTAQPTQQSTASNSGSSMGNSDADGSVLVPFRLFDFVDEDTLALNFTGDLAGAPVFNAADFPGPLNFGWDTTFSNFWAQGGNSAGGSNNASPTATP